MTNDESPSYKFTSISTHEVFESKSGNIVIAEFSPTSEEQHIIMPPWRARQIVSAIEELLDHIHARENPPFDAEF